MSKHFFTLFREQHGLSQADLAEKIGVSRQMVGLIESGNRSITPENADAWARKLGVERRLLHPIFDEVRA